MQLNHLEKVPTKRAFNKTVNEILAAAKAEIERIERYLTEDRAVVTEFDDCTVRRIVNSITVSKDMELTIYLKGGYEVKGKCLPLKNTA